MTDRGYRMLLLAYPRGFRRRHGADLIGTMMDAAGPDGPSRTDLLHLAVAGLRQRFRPPVGRPLAVLAVVLSTFIAGGFGAAGVSWAAAWAQSPAPAVAGLVGVPVSADQDGDVTTADLLVAPGADRVGRHLRDTGWQVSPVPGTDDLEASAGTLWLRVFTFAGDTPSVYAEVTRVAHPAYVPAVLAGLVLGALAGWPAAVALTHRLRDSRRPVAVAAAATGLVALAVPAAFLQVALAVRLLFTYPGEEVRSLFWVWDSAVRILPAPVPGWHLALTVAGGLLVLAGAVGGAVPNGWKGIASALSH